jgi:hypothetical protein
MPSATKTTNYGLNQWDGNEYPKRVDFVADNALIDAQMKANADLAESKISTLGEDATPELGGEMDAGEHTIGFTEKDNGNSGTAKTIDLKMSNKHKLILTGNCILTLTAPSNPCSLTLKLIQDATGSREVTWPSAVKWPGGSEPTLSTDANAVDIVSIYYDGTNYYAMAGLAFS